MVTACAIFQVAITRCCVTPGRCLRETLHCPKKVAILPLIPIHCFPRLKQLVENRKNFNKRKKLPKTAGLCFALLNFNCESVGHNFAHFLHLKGTLVSGDDVIVTSFKEYCSGVLLYEILLLLESRSRL